MEVLQDLRPSDLPEFSVQVFSLILWSSLFTWKLIQWLARLFTSQYFSWATCGIVLPWVSRFSVHHNLIILQSPSWQAYMGFPLFAATHNYGPFRHPSPATRPVAQAPQWVILKFNPLLTSLRYNRTVFCLFVILSLLH